MNILEGYDKYIIKTRLAQCILALYAVVLVFRKLQQNNKGLFQGIKGTQRTPRSQTYRRRGLLNVWTDRAKC